MMPYSYNRLFQGNHKAAVAQGANEFDTPALEHGQAIVGWWTGGASKLQNPILLD